MNDLYFVFGLALTAMAVIIAFTGMRMEKFPSRPLFIGGLALMAFLVAGTGAFAVMLGREEHEVREHEIAEYEEELAAEAEEGDEASEESEPIDTEPVEGGMVELTSPEAGDLIFDPDVAEAEAGEVTLNYTNPSEVPHNVAIEDGAETVAQGETVTGGDAAAAVAQLEPGEYVFYCSIPSHREAGMEGELTVK